VNTVPAHSGRVGSLLGNSWQPPLGGQSPSKEVCWAGREVRRGEGEGGGGGSIPANPWRAWWRVVFLLGASWLLRKIVVA